MSFASKIKKKVQEKNKRIVEKKQLDLGKGTITDSPNFSQSICVKDKNVSLSFSHWYPGSGVVLDCIDS